MNDGLLLKALIKVSAGILIVGALLFIPAGDFAWKNGWLLMGLLFVPMVIVGFIMYFRAPDLLRSRLNAKEQRGAQKQVIGASALMFVAAFVLAGLNHRFGWMRFPGGVVAAGAVLFVASYMVYAEVLRENAYLSRTVEIQENQKVVDTGLYGIVRHPMYAATIVLFLSMALILDSPGSLVIMLAYIPIIVKRTLDEERVLMDGLDGYKEYMEKVKYRLVPYVW